MTDQHQQVNKLYYFQSLTRIIASDLSPERKRPFVRFLIWVYMDTEESSEVKSKNVKKQPWTACLAHSKSVDCFIIVAL